MFLNSVNRNAWKGGRRRFELLGPPSPRRISGTSNPRRTPLHGDRTDRLLILIAGRHPTAADEIFRKLGVPAHGVIPHPRRNFGSAFNSNHRQTFLLRNRRKVEGRCRIRYVAPAASLDLRLIDTGVWQIGAPVS